MELYVYSERPKQGNENQIYLPKRWMRTNRLVTSRINMRHVKNTIVFNNIADLEHGVRRQSER
jgi:hypothetical protein